MESLEELKGKDRRLENVRLMEIALYSSCQQFLIFKPLKKNKPGVFTHLANI
jgi:hypothetical protein